MPDKPAYFAFYPKDFVADDVVMAMTTEEIGAYILLLCSAWQQEPPGSIPADDAVLAKITRLDTVAWARCKPGVLAAFTLGSDDRYHQKRLRSEHAKALSKIRKRREAGKKGAEGRWKKDDDGEVMANAMRLPCDCHSERIANAMAINSSSCSEHSSSPANSGGVGGAGEGDGGFAAFWAVYPLKKAKQAAARAWAKLRPDAALQAVLLAAVEAQKRWDQWRRGIIPHAATWLNGRRWEDRESGTGDSPNLLGGIAEFLERGKGGPGESH